MPKHSSTEELAHELMRHFDVLVREFLLPQKGAQFQRSEAAILRLLFERESSNMSDLSAGLGLALSSTTGLVDRLVERGLVERTRPDADRRCVHVALTARGRRAVASLQRDRVRLGLGLLERLSAREQQELLALFRKVSGRER